MSRFLAFLSALFLAASPAWAAPQNWQMNFEPGATTIQAKINDFHDLLLVITGLIVLLVLVLLIWVIARYNHKSNPVPATFTHNRFWERMWTIIPIVILLIIAVPSFRLMYYQGIIPKPDLTIKVTGYQWYWGYEYPDQGLAFQSYMVPTKDLKEGQLRLLATDNPVVVPVGANVQILVTSSDVIHSWTVHGFGVKKDAVPGRLNETWFKVTRPGTYYGQCSEICGTGHAFMPIEVHALPQDEFDAWVAEAKTKFGDAGSDASVASAE